MMNTLALKTMLATAQINTITLDWDVGTFLKNSVDTLKSWGNYAIILAGVIMLIVGGWKIAMGLISHGKTQVNWVVNILLIIIGGAFCVGGWSIMSTISSGGKKTIEDLGNGTKTPTKTESILFDDNYTDTFDIPGISIDDLFTD